jgi:predicted nucleic acid-binding protein
MNLGFVADASVGSAWLLSSQSNTETDRLLDEARKGTPVYVPALWVLEVANTLLVLRRRRRLEEIDYRQSLLDLMDLRPRIDDQNLLPSLTKICDLAGQHALSIYDAVYLELALRRALPLASRDSALNKAAKRAGVRTLLSTR